ncbi:hypothetical protein AB0D94_17830 [Streptomyces sp. NPDC048255]|uniref:hypothetical protein n=1 Tax=Streptomyces sp. NPDC048255 TaxID=3154713 RepID=UPI0033FA1C39
MEAGTQRALAIIERGYRGAVETQFSDELYCAFLFHRHLGGLDVLLRGSAVTYAARAGRTPHLRLGNRDLTTLNEPRQGLGVLLDSGVGVWAEESDLRLHGLTGEESLLAGVRTAAAGSTALRWAGYRAVFYL